MKSETNKAGYEGANTKPDHKDLDMSGPMSEKDEVKKAERRTQKAGKKGIADPSVPAGLKNGKD